MPKSRSRSSHNTKSSIWRHPQQPKPQAPSPKPQASSIKHQAPSTSHVSPATCHQPRVTQHHRTLAARLVKADARAERADQALEAERGNVRGSEGGVAGKLGARGILPRPRWASVRATPSMGIQRGVDQREAARGGALRLLAAARDGEAVGLKAAVRARDGDGAVGGGVAALELRDGSDARRRRGSRAQQPLEAAAERRREV